MTLGPAGAPAAVALDASDDNVAHRLVQRGWTELAKAASPATCRRLAFGVEAVLGAGLPGVFAYLFDEPWQLGEAMRARTSRALGQPYVLVEDVWAFHVAPGQHGWPPHRGLVTPRLDRSVPEFLNVWVAVTDAPVDRACMHCVPLDDDPGYPRALERRDAQLDAAQAMPVTAGTALAWNANLLHWGGACSPSAGGPRASYTYSLCRADALAALGVAQLRAEELTLSDRVDVVARQIVTYGEGQADVSNAMITWAKGLVLLRETVTSLAGRKHP
ncbi:hypothetical protein AKJ09_07462 [Labilithrix luteola]|uniref:Phytanoyl-CoA dioxygenase n=1 Tax=Labilithrix luteola TaxID=1391654 RepID=A0A0K1Q508_9BACT|nr:hypothetical protein AKJ09_07462 [Labilithrix luteola]